MKKIFLLNLLLLFSFTLFAQDSSDEVIFIFKTKKKKIFHQNELKENVVDFYITGLKAQKDIDFVRQLFIKKDGVQKFVIAPDIIDGKRKATLILHQNLFFYYFKQMMIDFGVKKVIIDNEHLTPDEIGTAGKTKKIKDL
jgi:hypothetical protein